MRIRYLAIALPRCWFPPRATPTITSRPLSRRRADAASSLWGLHETYALTTPEHCPLSFVLGDLGVLVGSHRDGRRRDKDKDKDKDKGRPRGNNATQITYMAGPGIASLR